MSITIAHPTLPHVTVEVVHRGHSLAVWRWGGRVVARRAAGVG